MPLPPGPPTQLTPVPPDGTSSMLASSQASVTKLATPPSARRRQVETLLSSSAVKRHPTAQEQTLEDTEIEAAAHPRMPQKQFLWAQK